MGKKQITERAGEHIKVMDVLISLMVLMGFTGMPVSHTHKIVQFKHMRFILCQVYLHKVVTVKKAFHEKETACLVRTALVASPHVVLRPGAQLGGGRPPARHPHSSP